MKKKNKLSFTNQNWNILDFKNLFIIKLIPLRLLQTITVSKFAFILNHGTNKHFLMQQNILWWGIYKS